MIKKLPGLLYLDGRVKLLLILGNNELVKSLAKHYDAAAKRTPTLRTPGKQQSEADACSAKFCKFRRRFH
jgi:hypothetical protein